METLSKRGVHGRYFQWAPPGGWRSREHFGRLRAPRVLHPLTLSSSLDQAPGS